MSFEECEICGEKAFLRCEKHNKCDDCGLTKQECIDKKISLVHRCKGLFCDSCWKKRMDEKIKNFEGDTDYTDGIICPYCGHEQGDPQEYHDSDGKEVECNDCEKKFTLSIHFSVDYSTTKLEEAD